MAVVTIVLGLVLVVVGTLGFVATGASHPTALIPAGFGVLLAVLGVVALKDAYRKHAMHVAVLISLIGFVVPAVRTGADWPTLLTTGKVMKPAPASPDGGEPELLDKTAAVNYNFKMAIVCLGHFLLSINSFVQARLARKAAEGTAVPEPARS